MAPLSSSTEASIVSSLIVNRAISRSSTCPLRTLARPRPSWPIASLPIANAPTATAPSASAPTAVRQGRYTLASHDRCNYPSEPPHHHGISGLSVVAHAPPSGLSSQMRRRGSTDISRGTPGWHVRLNRRPLFAKTCSETTLRLDPAE